MSRRGAAKGRRTRGKLGLRLAIVCGGGALVAAVLLVVLMVQTLAGYIPYEHAPVVRQGWMFGIAVAVLAGGAIGLAAYLQGGQIASRLTDLGLGVSKLGRGATEVRVRVTGNDEVTALGRQIQYLATDLAAMHEELERSGGSAASMDPQVRELRDKALEHDVAQPEGFEVDGAICAGSRGGLDYFGSVAIAGSGGVVYAISGEGASAVSVLACRMARDEIVRALEAGATARKALAHTNRVLHKKLPRGACAKASLLELSVDSAKLYHAGYRAPCWIYQAGEVLEISAEGLALGLDAGPVFEKGLRSENIPMQPGVRLVQTNDAGVRSQDLLDLVQLHSPKHSAPFMNLVVGGLEVGAGSEGLREDVLLVTVKRS